jgi:hypothetical protein
VPCAQHLPRLGRHAFNGAVNIIKPPRVFISYAYDSVRHKQQVLEFASFLRAEGGIDIRLDLWDANRRRDWSVWVVEQVREADFVLVVASPAYKRRAEGSTDSSEGRGVQFESALLRDLVTRAWGESVHKVLPVVLPGRSVREIPAFLQPHAASHYVVGSLTTDGIDELYRIITRQPRHCPPVLGRLIIRPTAEEGY